MITQELLHAVLMCSWGEDTLRPQDKKEWSKYTPFINQCCVTALIVQDYFGGDLFRCKMTNGGSHYFNILPSKEMVDLTKEQFLYIKGQPIYDTAEVRNRKKILSYPITRERYEILKKRVEEKLYELKERE